MTVDGTKMRAPFREDIQGLRAVAVLLVLIYHTGAGALTGGYVGVDVFFVISGFLITSHLFYQLQVDGRIDFRQFYARRARRILPVSFVVLLLTIAASYFFIAPVLLPDILHDAIWVALYVPNMAFAVDGTNYLAETAASPFQHYWSLGVEEQFYLFWPLVLLVIWLLSRASRRKVTSVIVLLVALSFIAGVVLTSRNQPWAFFGLHTRAWELGAGALVAVAGPEIVSRIPPALRSIGTWLGLAAILFAGGVFDESTPFPGSAAFVPVVGAAAVIFFGQQATPFGAATVLRIRPMVFIGAISYSLYLVHWPLLVIPAAVGGSTESLPVLASVGLALIAVPVAWVLYVAVENPVRRSKWLSLLKARWSLVLAAVVSATAIALAITLIGVVSSAPQSADKPAAQVVEQSVAPVFTDYVPTNLDPSLKNAASDIPKLYSDGCHLSFLETNVQTCAFGDTTSSTVIALFGDSHAAQWFPALEKIALREGIRLESYTKSSCPSVNIDIYVDAVLYSGCNLWRQRVIQHLNQTKPNLIVISNMSKQPEQPGGEIDPDKWATGLAGVLDRLPDSRTAVISDTPHQSGTPSICLSANLHSTAKCAEPRPEAIDTHWQRTEAASGKASGAAVLNFNDYICDSETCGLIIGSTLVYRDAHHLTKTFVESLAPALWRDLSPLLDISE